MDFTDIIADTMYAQMEAYPKQYVFRYSSFLVHMLLHQNIDFFTSYIQLATTDDSDPTKAILVSAWTHVLSTSYDYYTFSKLFLTLMLLDLYHQDKLDRIADHQKVWMVNSKLPSN